MSFNPIYKATPETLSELQRTTGTATADGALRVSVGTGTSSITVQGPAADDAAVVGNPIVIAGKYESTLNTVENGDVSTLKTDVNGRLLTAFAGASVSQDFTPAAAAYLANDIMATAKTFALIGPATGGEIVITTVELLVAHTAVISGETSYRLYLYSVTPPSAPADNDAWDLPSGDRTSFRGYVDLGTPIDLGSSLYVQTLQVNKQVTVGATGSLFGLLVTNGPFTATAAARTVTLHSVAV